jgi:hypothetical protein
MFFSCILAYSAFGPDDGSCELLNFAGPCKNKNTEWGLRNECVWSELNDSCSYAAPVIDALAIIVYTILIALFTMPVAKLMEYFAKHLFIKKEIVVKTGKSPFFWSIKEKKRLPGGGTVVPVDDDGDVYEDDSDDEDDDTEARERKRKNKEKALAEGDIGPGKDKNETKVGHDGEGEKNNGNGLVVKTNNNDDDDDDDLALDAPVSPLGDKDDAPELQLEYWEVCDEMTDCQTVSSRWLRAARLRKLQEYADFVLPMMEVEMLIALNNHELQYFGRQLLITEPKK